jgi:hypothetical protein
MVAALEHMSGRGVISEEDGGWILRVPLDQIDLEVPESLRQMIEVQIERLATEEQRALEAASITLAGFNATVNAVAANLNPARERNRQTPHGLRGAAAVRMCARYFAAGTHSSMPSNAVALSR